MAHLCSNVAPLSNSPGVGANGCLDIPRFDAEMQRNAERIKRKSSASWIFLYIEGFYNLLVAIRLLAT